MANLKRDLLKMLMVQGITSPVTTCTITLKTNTSCLTLNYDRSKDWFEWLDEITFNYDTSKAEYDVRATICFDDFRVIENRPNSYTDSLVWDDAVWMHCDRRPPVPYTGGVLDPHVYYEIGIDVAPNVMRLKCIWIDVAEVPVRIPCSGVATFNKLDTESMSLCFEYKAVIFDRIQIDIWGDWNPDDRAFVVYHNDATEGYISGYEIEIV
jgi:hypothetical protein